MAGLYIHIPFCKQACYYCDFHFSTQQSQRSDLIKLIARELELQHDYLQGEILETLYFGGGTPSLLTPAELDVLFTTIHKHFSVAQTAEVTLEANPDDLTPEKLAMLRLAGINRLSIGIQSFDEEILRFLNRAHSPGQAHESVAHARHAGFHNINIDLIHSIPGQDDHLLMKNLEVALSLSPEHISAYSLTIEEKTVFGRWNSRGKLKPVGEEQAARQFELVMDTLTARGYRHYEVSNFCLPGYESKHNTSYWQQKYYLGVGPSAHSFNGVSRQFTISNNQLYAKALSADKIPFEREILTREDKINEYLFTSLRLDTGCSLSQLKHHYDYDLQQEQGPYLIRLFDQQLATLENDRLILTRAGKLLADQISSELFILNKK